jgi:hypothetical protein
MHTTLNFRENVMQLLLSHGLPSSAALDLIEAADHSEPASYIVDGEQFEVIREHTGHVNPGFRYVIDSTVLADRPEAPWYQNAPQSPVQAQEQAEANAALAADQAQPAARVETADQKWWMPGLYRPLADAAYHRAHRVNRGSY